MLHNSQAENEKLTSDYVAAEVFSLFSSYVACFVCLLSPWCLKWLKLITCVFHDWFNCVVIRAWTKNHFFDAIINAMMRQTENKIISMNDLITSINMCSKQMSSTFGSYNSRCINQHLFILSFGWKMLFFSTTDCIFI